jgi:phospholipase/carboxylesterase
MITNYTRALTKVREHAEPTRQLAAPHANSAGRAAQLHRAEEPNDDIAHAIENTGRSVTKPSHAHQFIAGTETRATPLVLLHGSDGTECDLLPLAEQLAPGAARIGIRGTITTDGGHAFFRRFPDRRIDEVDLATRTPILADFIQTSCTRHGLRDRPIAVGFSNGAIMTAALLTTHPDLLTAAILFRPLSPFARDLGPIPGTPVLILDGADDHRRSVGDGERLAQRLRLAGAAVTHRVLPTGHAISTEDQRIAHEWLRSLKF